MAATIPPLESKYVKTKIATLNEAIGQAESETSKCEAILTHIKAVENDPCFQIDPEFPTDLEWLNSTGALSFERELKGKIVVLDFFTYCCINCMHILPDLGKLESKYRDTDGVVVVGVHSAKFQNEKLSENIDRAVERYGITHPVVNDQRIVLWERLGVTCWPTLVIVGPDRQLLYYIIGEGHGEELAAFMDGAVGYYQDRLSHDPIGKLSPSERDVARMASVLKYPGKVCVDGSGSKIFVSDTAHHQVIVATLTSGEQSYQPVILPINPLAAESIYMYLYLFHVAIETKTTKPNNSASTDQPRT